ncbi:glycerol-3-phosphate 1-O-acyltransferase PlsY [Lutibaculum baratangense]|uniref:Glycerol-3-phosphate acyltransferase n=1 Tax=Lutibaculum baratangense AMV1 TaxID=631454 RepID=V4RBR8_9HYPH|nr:glycerol-3-phosphate 1-O-acyltransferase PlsY [Lutibaculum baratangense]ESR23601.1 Acyl-phosphate:glycerol-3-phosphate O-acyltransferase PlsY [Lutibaculum baratangense AMV1]
MTSEHVIALFAALAFGYLMGSIPFGVIVTRLSGLGDIRKIGSGNIGMTNVLRTGRKDLAALTLLGDALKATVAVFIAAFWAEGAPLAAGLGAFVGHLFPVWLGFKGGKGVATYLGILIALAWPIALAFAALWGATAYLTRYSSLSALVASGATPALLLATGATDRAALFLVLTAMLYAAHRTNISKLVRGEESRIGQRG